MVNYRRNRLQGGTYFFTVTLADRASDALVRHVDSLRDAWRRAATRVSHDAIAVVVLPDHLHALVAMTDGDDDYPRLWQDIKKGFTRRIPGSKSPWQPRYWEHTIRDETDYRAHFDYIHINPVKHGLVRRAADWPHSSFHRYCRQGLLDPDWAAEIPVDGRFGEP
jgi:putative transposase